MHSSIHTLVVVKYNGNHQHQHPPPDDIILSTVIIDEMKRRIDGDPTKHLPKMWEDVVEWHENAHGHGFVYPDFHEFKSTLYRHRPESLPPLPATINDIDFAAINHEWSRTHRGTQFLRKHDVNFGITIFTSLEQLELLANSRFNLADGTLRPRRHLTNRYTPYMGLRTIAGCHSFLP